MAMSVHHVPIDIHKLKPDRVQLRVSVYFDTVQNCSVCIMNDAVERRVSHHNSSDDIRFIIWPQRLMTAST